MKLLIASDIHGSAYYCEKLMAQVEKHCPDKLLLLGDLLYHGPRNDLPREYAPKRVISMLSAYQDIIVAVRGNCEAEVDQMASLKAPQSSPHQAAKRRSQNDRSWYISRQPAPTRWRWLSFCQN